jgi:hypothetical protein
MAKQQVGRPSTKTPLITFGIRFSAEERERYEREAEACGLNLTNWIRLALKTALNEKGGN